MNDNYYNKIQINLSIDKDENDTILKKSLMINIRSDSVDEAEKLYRALKDRLNSSNPGSEESSQNRNSTSGSNPAPICDQCSRKMTLRQGKRGQFYGCSGFPSCRNTKEVEEVASEDADAVGADEAVAF